MLGEERQQAILAAVEQRHSVSVQELMQLLDISESTIRRDLNALDKEGRLVKVHGGAMAIGGSFHVKDDAVEYRKEINREEKIEIARYAAALIKDQDVVYMDAGTTTELMIDYITAKNVIFVTNSFAHAKHLSQKGYTTYILGGEFKPVTEAIVGEEAIISLDKYNFTKGFWGANGVTKGNGFTTPDVKEAMVKKKSMENCKECFVLADESKFNQISSVTFAPFEGATVITTGLSLSAYKKCKNVIDVKQ
mgnify:CR=1 FL=1